MTAFDGTGFQKQLLLNVGQPGYSLGSFDSHQATAKFLITAVSLTSDVATITGSIVEGNIPVAGQLISVRGTQTSGGEFNVSNVAIASVSINATSGQGTITYALSDANVSSTADAGEALIQVAEIAENIGMADGGYAGQAFALPAYVGIPNQGRTITWSYYWTTPAATSLAIALEGAETIADFVAGRAKALDTGTNNTATGETKVIQVPTTINFLRVNVTAIDSTGNVLGVAKIEV